MDIDKECRHILFFYLGIALWLTALSAWMLYITPLALISGCLASVSFLFHYSQKKILNMFGKNKKTLPTVSQPDASPSSTNVSTKNIPPYTVIGSGICIEGHLISSGHIEVYGEVKGDIQVNDGLVRVMSGGKVNGNITCNELYVDGEVRGECNAKITNVDENGNISGVLTYSCLSVRHGAVLSGTLNFKEQPIDKILSLTDTKETVVVPELPDRKVAKEIKSVSRQK